VRRPCTDQVPANGAKDIIEVSFRSQARRWLAFYNAMAIEWPWRYKCVLIPESADRRILDALTVRWCEHVVVALSSWVEPAPFM